MTKREKQKAEREIQEGLQEIQTRIIRLEQKAEGASFTEAAAKMKEARIALRHADWAFGGDQ